MGLCIDEDENKYKITFEIRRDSVKFYDKTFFISAGDAGMIELSKKQLKKIAELCNDEEWKEKIFGAYDKKKEEVVKEDNTLKLYRIHFKANGYEEAGYEYFAALNKKQALDWALHEELGNRSYEDIIHETIEIITASSQVPDNDLYIEPLPAFRADSNLSDEVKDDYFDMTLDDILYLPHYKGT